MKLYVHPLTQQLMPRDAIQRAKFNPDQCEWIETNTPKPTERKVREWWVTPPYPGHPTMHVYDEKRDPWPPGSTTLAGPIWMLVREVLPE